MKNQIILSTMFAIVLVFFSASFVLADSPNVPVDTYEIPDPETPLMDPSKTITLGKLSSSHDDFVSYSAGLLNQLGYAGYNISTGTGGVDLLLMSGSNFGNDAVQGGDGDSSTFFMFPPALESPNANQAHTLSDAWGNSVVVTNGNNSTTYGYASVDKVLDFLHTYGPDINIPVFSFDMNEEKNSVNEDLYIAGLVRIFDMQNIASPVEKARWAFDNDEDYDIDDANWDGWVLADGHIVIGDPNAPFYDIENNTGGGDVDFIAYAPLMDLTLFDDPKYMMLFDFRMKDLEAGAEQVFMTGRYYPESSTIPEPATMLLFGTGLVGFAVRRRKI